MLTAHRPRLLLTWQHPNAATTGYGALAVAILAGATFTPLAKSLGSALSPLSLIFISELLSLAFVGMSFGLFPMVRQLVDCNRRTQLAILAIGVCSGVLGPFLWFTGLHYTTAVNASFFGKSDLVFLLFLASALVRERLTPQHLIVCSIILLGMIIIALQGFTASIVPQLGDVLIVASAFCYSLGSCIFRRYLSHIPPHLAVLGRTCTALAAFFLISPFLQHPFIEEVMTFPSALVPMLVAFAFFSRFLNTFAFYIAADHLPIKIISPLTTFDVIVSVAIASALLGERVLWFHAIGGACIIIGNIALQYLGVHDDDEHVKRHAVERIAHRTA
ncbi:MAG: hypothetical protein G01um101425_938 [Candidatus Peregrinibacteria bacterium Gr01-1014_25]|nr:MAG: hypothetical protein G01um101425_938 [Candidatus Peregrinibacteria bacterium Gr01-1014_25]